jgi:hypothetical protein
MGTIPRLTVIPTRDNTFLDERILYPTSLKKKKNATNEDEVEQSIGHREGNRSLTSATDEVEGKLQDPAVLPPERKPPWHSINGMLSGNPDQSRCDVGGKYFYLCR